MIIIVGNNSNDINIKVEDVERKCLACGMCGRHRIFKRDNKLSVFFVPLITWQKQYMRTCPYCGVTVEINKEDII